MVLTSDHGDMLGERGLLFKITFLERSVRVPLIVHSPARFRPARIEQAVSLVDLGPPLVSLASDDADVEFPTPVDGMSLLAAIGGDTSDGEVFGEYYAEGTTTPMLMVQRGSRKAIVAAGDPPQLFDVEADPEELHNLAGSLPQEVTAIEAEVAARWKAPPSPNRSCSVSIGGPSSAA